MPHDQIRLAQGTDDASVSDMLAVVDPDTGEKIVFIKRGDALHVEIESTQYSRIAITRDLPSDQDGSPRFAGFAGMMIGWRVEREHVPEVLRFISQFTRYA